MLLKNILFKLKLSNPNSIKLFSDHTRDRNNLKVFRCSKSGCIFLENTKHIDNTYYINKDSYSYWGSKNREEALNKTKTDDLRRSKQFKPLISKKNWLDVGTGSGGILDLLSPVAKTTHAVEPQKQVRDYLNNHGYKVFDSISSCQDNFYDIITLFHVFEHITKPLDFLKTIKNKLKKNGTIIIEIPHGNDALISKYKCQKFIEHTLWSEHVCLYARKALTKFLSFAGYKSIEINGFQRYSLANHLYWLSEGKPNGNIIWKELSNKELDSNYNKILESNDITDTLIARAKK